jgi:pimeloyl-[acyl-carrier protein] methyl ester esterase
MRAASHPDAAGPHAAVATCPRPLPEIVLLPGLDGTGIAFRSLREALPEFQSRIVDYPREGSGYPRLLEQVRARLPIENPYLLVGESYAGPLVVSIAAARPANLLGIVLCATFLSCPRPLLGSLRSLLRVLPARRLPARWLAPLLLGKYATPQHCALIDETLAAASPRAMLRRLHDVASVDVTAEARRVEVPALYLRALGDRLVPRPAGERIRATMAGVELVELPAPHLLLQARADLAALRIRGFVHRLVGR